MIGNAIGSCRCFKGTAVLTLGHFDPKGCVDKESFLKNFRGLWKQSPKGQGYTY